MAKEELPPIRSAFSQGLQYDSRLLDEFAITLGFMQCEQEGSKFDRSDRTHQRDIIIIMQSLNLAKRFLPPLPLSVFPVNAKIHPVCGREK